MLVIEAQKVRNTTYDSCTFSLLIPHYKSTFSRKRVTWGLQGFLQRRHLSSPNHVVFLFSFDTLTLCAVGRFFCCHLLYLTTYLQISFYIQLYTSKYICNTFRFYCTKCNCTLLDKALNVYIQLYTYRYHFILLDTTLHF